MISELMEEIVNLDTEVGIYRLFLAKSNFSSGFDAWVTFRSWGQDINHVEAHGETAQEALEKLRNGLLDKFMSRKFYMENK